MSTFPRSSFRLPTFLLALLLGVSADMGCFILHIEECGPSVGTNPETASYQLTFLGDALETCWNVETCLKGDFYYDFAHPDHYLTPAECCNIVLLNEQGEVIGNTSTDPLCQGIYLDPDSSPTDTPEETGDSNPTTTDTSAETTLTSTVTEDTDPPVSTSSSTEEVTTTDASTSTGFASTTDAESSSTTTPPDPCGNKSCDEGEVCDDGNTVDGDGCESTCLGISPPGVCGNGVLDWNETCDPPNSGCTAACGISSCGDGVIQDGEQCDDYAKLDSLTCTPGCKLIPTCEDNAQPPVK